MALGGGRLDTVEEFLVEEGGNGTWVAREGLGEARYSYGGTAVAASLVCGKVLNLFPKLPPATSSYIQRVSQKKSVILEFLLDALYLHNGLP